MPIYNPPTSGTGEALSVTDGSTTVDPATSLDFTSGATVTDGGGGIAQVAIGGSQPFSRQRVTIDYADLVPDMGGSAQAPLYTLPDGAVIFAVYYKVVAAFDDSGIGDAGLDIVDGSFQSILQLALQVSSETTVNTNWTGGVVATISTGADHTAYVYPPGANIEADGGDVPFQVNAATYAGDGSQGSVVIDLYIWTPTA